MQHKTNPTWTACATWSPFNICHRRLMTARTCMGIDSAYDWLLEACRACSLVAPVSYAIFSSGWLTYSLWYESIDARFSCPRLDALKYEAIPSAVHGTTPIIPGRIILALGSVALSQSSAYQTRRKKDLETYSPLKSLASFACSAAHIRCP